MHGEEDLVDESLKAQRAKLAGAILRLGLDAGIAKRLSEEVSIDQLSLFEALIARLKPSSDDPKAPEPMPLDDYRALLHRLGDEYIGYLTLWGLSNVDVTREQLQKGAEFLTGLARVMRATPIELRPAMWPAVHRQMSTALSHYQVIKRAAMHTGIADALDAERNAVLVNLRRELLPDMDLILLQMAGESDSERAIQSIIGSTRSAPDAALNGHSVGQLLDEAEDDLRKSIKPPPTKAADPPAPTPKRWTGWGKVFNGAALIGVNIAGGVALGIGGGPFEPGATVSGVLVSCGAGIGSISAGVGDLRGE